MPPWCRGGRLGVAPVLSTSLPSTGFNTPSSGPRLPTSLFKPKWTWTFSVPGANTHLNTARPKDFLFLKIFFLAPRGGHWHTFIFTTNKIKKKKLQGFKRITEPNARVFNRCLDERIRAQRAFSRSRGGFPLTPHQKYTGAAPKCSTPRAACASKVSRGRRILRGSKLLGVILRGAAQACPDN